MSDVDDSADEKTAPLKNEVCDDCGRIVHRRWAYCPSCAHSLDQDSELATDGGEDVGRGGTQCQKCGSNDWDQDGATTCGSCGWRPRYSRRQEIDAAKGGGST